jgi:glucosylceramidase
MAASMYNVVCLEPEITIMELASMDARTTAFRGAALLLTMAMLLGGCGSSSPPPPPPAAPAPTFWPVPGTYSPSPGAPLSVTLADAAAGATIYYTMDGTSPTTSSAPFSGPITVASTTTIQAIAVSAGYSQSGIATGAFTITPQIGSATLVSVVVTTTDQTRLLAPQSSMSFSTAGGGNNVVFVDETEVYQQIEGFGAATTDSAAYLLMEVTTPSALSSTMNDLFTRQGNGIGISFLRNPMGASDLARSAYSYDDNGGQPDLDLTIFSIAHDRADIVPLIQHARQLNPQLKIMATPWSPPGWMKSSSSMIGGSLLTDTATRSAFANYFVQYLQAYGKAGIPIDYLSLQNEPLNVPADYPGMSMDAATQAAILKDYVLPALSTSGVSTKVLIYDHNWDQPGYPQAILADPALRSSGQIAGIAWHGYAGTPGVMTALNNLYPNLGNYETELSGGAWVPNQIKGDFEGITQVMRNWAKSYLKWSLALDQNHGPHTGGCGNCNPLVTVNSASGAITYNVDYYTLGHFSKFVLPGAHRVYSSNANGIVSAAFVNPAPDNSRALVAYNDSSTTQTFVVQWGTQAFTYTLPSLAGATFIWRGTQSGGYTVSANSQIQASSYNSTSGLQTELTSDTNGGYDLGYSNNASYAVYKNVDFGAGISGVSARVACDPGNGGNCGGALEFHLDSAAGTVVCSVTIPATGGWQTWQTATGKAAGASGVHDVYAVFKGATSLGNFNWFKFN